MHYREWDAAGHKFLIRADDRRVLCDGREMKLSEIKNEVRLQGKHQNGPFTPPALLAGLCALLAMMVTLEEYNINSPTALIDRVNLPIPLLKPG